MLAKKYTDPIERFIAERCGKDTLYTPSGRVALYLALTEWLDRGDRILMSTLNDDVVFFTVLAAGMVPVLAPVNPATGNLDPRRVDEETWKRLKAVMTTNLYGIPDEMDLIMERCDQFGLLLLEDACQAIETHFGRKRIGEFGPVAFYSFTKHVHGMGGALAFDDAARLSDLVEKRDRLFAERTFKERLLDSGRLFARHALADGFWQDLRRWRNRIQPPPRSRGSGHRMLFEPAPLFALYRQGGGLVSFDQWVRCDNIRYRTAPTLRELKYTLNRLGCLAKDRAKRIRGVRQLLDLGLTPAEIHVPQDIPLHRVPLFVEEREEVLRRFAGQGLLLDYVYDPPLDMYAPEELAERVPSQKSARIWSEHVLPVDPLYADPFLKILKRLPPLTPAGAEAF